MPSSKGWRYRKADRTLRETGIGEVLDGLLREGAFARGLPIGRLAASWEDVVGPRMAKESAPVSLEGGVLVVATSSGAWGTQVQFLSEEVRKRANRALGSEDVAKVRVVVRPEPRKGLWRNG
jgi:predicted nucleic acid-binding Zn ribbon protein